MRLNKLMLLFFFSLILLPAISGQESRTNTQISYNLHRVTKQQTLYGLSKEYNVTIDEIKNANDGLPNGLQDGMLIKIPVNSNSKPEIIEPVSQIKPEKKKFFEYQARVKELIYPLALRYQVSVDSIFALNPGITETLRTDQIIKIPIVKNTTGYITHSIKHALSLSKLAKYYNLPVDEIKSINPYISRDLKVGQVVRIPVMKMDSDEHLNADLMPAKSEKTNVEETDLVVPVEDLCDKDHSAESFQIALMLPLYLSQVDTPADTTVNEGALLNFRYLKSFTFIQFYEGFMMAVDSLRKTGLNCELFVYNVEDDVFETKKVLTDPQLKSMDLIVGPAFAKTFTLVAEFAKQQKINIVNPFSSRNEIIYNNPFVFKVKPSQEFQYETLAEFLNLRYPDAQLFLVRQNQYRDEVEFHKLESILNQRLISNSIEPYHEINYGNDSLVSFLKRASSFKKNVVIIYSENKAFIFDMLRKLNEIRDKYQITVIGIPNWKKMEDIEIEHVINLNTHFLTTEFINYDSPGVKGFVRNFRQKYQTEPQQYAFEGFDTGAFFISALMKYGKQLSQCIQNYEYNGMQSGFRFENMPESGFSNKYWKVLRVADFRFEDVSPSENH